MLYSRHSHTEDPLYHPVVIKDEQRFWKRILIVDDEKDITLAFKAGIEDNNAYTNRKISLQATCGDFSNSNCPYFTSVGNICYK